MHIQRQMCMYLTNTTCPGGEAMELEVHSAKITILPSSIDADEARLRQLGYKQELKRGLS